MKSENHKAGSNFKWLFSPFPFPINSVPNVFVIPDTAVRLFLNFPVVMFQILLNQSCCCRAFYNMKIFINLPWSNSILFSLFYPTYTRRKRITLFHFTALLLGGQECTNICIILIQHLLFPLGHVFQTCYNFCWFPFNFIQLCQVFTETQHPSWS